jgi:hypothetical protein
MPCPNYLKGIFMQQYVKQLSLICVFGASTIMAGTQSPDQLGADIQELVVQLTDICNQKCSASLRARVRGVLIEGRQAIVYQLGLFDQGMSLEQVESDKKVVECRNTLSYRLQPLQEEIVADLQHRDELVNVVMTVQGVMETFFSDRLDELMRMGHNTAAAKKQTEYVLLAIDAALENLQ